MPNCTPHHQRPESQPSTALTPGAALTGTGPLAGPCAMDCKRDGVSPESVGIVDGNAEPVRVATATSSVEAIEAARGMASAVVARPGQPEGEATGQGRMNRTAEGDRFALVIGGADTRRLPQQPSPEMGTNGSVWVTGQICSRDQRKGRYVPASIYHPGKMLPSIARHVIGAFTSVGDIVADPMCGIGTTIVEAMHAGRTGIGVEYEKRWADLANENIEYATAQGATGTGQVWCGDGGSIAEMVPDEIRGHVALVITSPPYGSSTHGRAYTGNRRVGRKVLKAHHKYGESPGNLAYVQPQELAAGFTGILGSAVAILRPGGIVAITARPYRERGELVDIPGMVIAAGQAAGLTLIDRKVALLCGVRDGHLVARSSFFQIKNVRQAADDGSAPLHVVQHEDLLIFELQDRKEAN